uniref:Uncharacterized protein n=1 Tax=Anguilla anguilla TaxID=7936 RepID=A0A0E9XBM2_ANGAN
MSLRTFSIGDSSLFSHTSDEMFSNHNISSEVKSIVAQGSFMTGHEEWHVI